MRRLLLLFLGSVILTGQPKSPEDIFGFKVGADYKLADYSQMLTFHRQLAKNSDRVLMEEIGKSSEGRPMILLYISSSENLTQLEKWKKISSELSRASAGSGTAQAPPKPPSANPINLARDINPSLGGIGPGAKMHVLVYLARLGIDLDEVILDDLLAAFCIILQDFTGLQLIATFLSLVVEGSGQGDDQAEGKAYEQ